MVRAAKKLKNDELLVVALAGTRLRMELDRVPLWRGDHVEVRQLAEDFARYLYLPRLKDTGVLLVAIGDGTGLLSWSAESFAYADSFDEAAGRYVGLRGGRNVSFPGAEPTGLLVRPDVASKQLAEVTPKPPEPKVGDTAGKGVGDGSVPPVAEPKLPKRFHGSVTLDAARVGRDAGRIADEVISHLAGIVGAEVRVTLEIEGNVPSGVPEKVVRIVTENARTLKFESQGFEGE